MSLDDDSLSGSVIVHKNPTIKKRESKYKYGVEHRFYADPEKKFKSDKPILALFRKNNKWRTISAIVEETGMAERTLHYACRRFIKHDIFEETTLTKMGIGKLNKRHPETRLYRLTTKGKNDARRDFRKV